MQPKLTLSSVLPIQPFEIKSNNALYTVYPRITKPLAEAVFKQTGLWLFPRFKEKDEIQFIAGEGYFGGMCLCQSKTTQRFLGIKIILGERKVKISAEEGKLQSQLNGMKRLMPLVDSFETTLGNHNTISLCHIMPIAAFGSVKSISQTLHDKKISKELLLAVGYEIGHGLLSGLQQLHNNNLYHLDIKPDNIVVDGQGRACLIDFGCIHSSKADERLTQDSMGDYDYSSPERRKVRGDKRGYYTGRAADVWAAGMTLLYFFEGVTLKKDPWEDVLENPKKLLQKLRQDSTLPGGWLTFLEGLLIFDPQNPDAQLKRLTASEALNKLEALKPEHLGQQLQQLPELLQGFNANDNSFIHPISSRLKEAPFTIPELNQNIRVSNITNH